jgi:hypothetical protein
LQLLAVAAARRGADAGQALAADGDAEWRHRRDEHVDAEVELARVEKK